MDQIKIGVFIAELRKEQDMTQRQLAESIGVSDKTISKWECGNGLPELSTIPELCRVLQINMNELLSGERLEEEVYSVKAEENMMTLMKETEEHKKKNKTSLFAMVLCLTGVMATLLLAVSIGIGSSAFMAFFDIPTLIMLIVPSLLILAAAGLLKSFFRAFVMLGKNVEQYTEAQWSKAKKAIRLGAASLFTVGSLESLATLIILLGYYRQGMPLEQFLANTAVASLGILYGIIAYLFLLPVRYKLDMEMEETIR